MRVQYLTPCAVARKLKVSTVTVDRWIKCGKLLAKRKVTYRYLVPETALTSVREVKCLWCGKVIIAKRPLRRRFCNPKHCQAYRYMMSKSVGRAMR